MTGVRAWWRGSDLALLYAGTVLGFAGWMLTMTPGQRTRFVLACSTNLANLREFPIRVLLISAVVVQTLPELLLLLPLVVAVTASTRWLGRSATFVALAFGHVVATLAVAALLAAGVHRGLLDPGVARSPDVGTSYALAGVAGLLTARWRGLLRLAYLAAGLGVLAALLLVDPDFTEVGHLVAFVVGLGLALVAARAQRAALTPVPSPPTVPSPATSWLSTRAVPARQRRPADDQGA